MFIAYVTTDEVNRSVANALAEKIGVDVSFLLPEDPTLDCKYDVLLFDLDHLLPWREDILERLLKQCSTCAVAVHSYNLTGDQVKALQRNGVAVYRRLGPRALLARRRAPRRRPLSIRGQVDSLPSPRNGPVYPR
jgi:hypothetical protein